MVVTGERGRVMGEIGDVGKILVRMFNILILGDCYMSIYYTSKFTELYTNICAFYFMYLI